jgi:anaerobic selenocysteine-containing dehydrogenase
MKGRTGRFERRGAMATEHRTFCRICISACGMTVTVEGDEVIAIRGDATHPHSRGYLCPKGRALGAVHAAEGRLDGAFIGRGGERRAVDIDEGHAHLRGALGEIVASHGLGSIGVFHGTGAFLDSAGSWATRRLKKVLGSDYSYSTATVDAIAKTFVAEQMAGTAALIPCIDEQHGRLLVFVGVNPVVSHGHSTMFSNPVERIRAAKARGPVFVLDPRVSETARLADRHLAARPGTDYAVFAHVLRALLAAGVDTEVLAQRATGLEDLRAAVAPFDGPTTCRLTGVDQSGLDELVRAVVGAGRLAILTGTGSTMSVPGNLTEWLAWALLVMTDSFDQPGGMWFNPGLFARLDRFDKLPAVGPPAPGCPTRPDIPPCGGEWPASLIPDEIEAGRLRALIVVGGNLVTALPDTERVVRALGAIDVLVGLDIQHTPTTDLATHVFACADQLERPDVLPLEMHASALYQQYTDAVVTPPPRRPPLWRTLCHIARGVGLDMLGHDADPDDVTNEDMLARLARRFPLEELRGGGVRTEAPAVYGWVQPRLPLGRWELAPSPLVEQLATVVEPASLVVTPRRPTRRMNAQQYRDGDRSEAWMHPDDAARAGVVDGDMVEVASSTGRIELPARVTTAIAAGAISVQHGWVSPNVNRLIDAHDLDPLTGMAHLSGTAVTVHASN